MKYFKITYSNGYCGCDDEYYVKLNDEDADKKIDQIFNDNFDWYAYNSDERFMDDVDPEDYDNEEDYETALSNREDAYDELIRENSAYEEVTKEEYDEEVEWGAQTI